MGSQHILAFEMISFNSEVTTIIEEAISPLTCILSMCFIGISFVSSKCPMASAPLGSTSILYRWEAGRSGGLGVFPCALFRDTIIFAFLSLEVHLEVRAQSCLIASTYPKTCLLNESDLHFESGEIFDVSVN